MKLNHRNGGEISRLARHSLKATRKLFTSLILPQVQEAYESKAQWLDAMDYDNVAKYHHQLEALLELIEVANCGSTGGFDTFNGKDQRDLLGSIDSRYSWVLYRAKVEFDFEVVGQALVKYGKREQTAWQRQFKAPNREDDNLYDA